MLSLLHLHTLPRQQHKWHVGLCGFVDDFSIGDAPGFIVLAVNNLHGLHLSYVHVCMYTCVS